MATSHRPLYRWNLIPHEWAESNTSHVPTISNTVSIVKSPYEHFPPEFLDPPSLPSSLARLLRCHVDLEHIRAPLCNLHQPHTLNSPLHTPSLQLIWKPRVIQVDAENMPLHLIQGLEQRLQSSSEPYGLIRLLWLLPRLVIDDVLIPQCSAGGEYTPSCRNMVLGE